MQIEERTRGLPAIHEARRRRLGFPRTSPRLWLWAFIILAVWAIIYWKVTQESLTRTRNALLTRQRDVAAELNPRFVPLRDRVERIILDGAGSWPGDSISPDSTSWSFGTRPGIYIRVLVDEAKNAESLRRTAMGSLRDAFTSCLLQSGNVDPWSGPECKHNHECSTGQHCNEVHHCTVPAQPYNLRVFYRGLHVFTDDWVRQVRDAGDDMRLRLLEREFESTIKEDMPLAIDLAVRGQYLLVVLDEAPEGGPPPDGGNHLEAVESMPHSARVVLYDLQRDKPLIRVRRLASAELVGPSTDPKTSMAVRRQANSCGLAVAVRKAMGDVSAP